MGKYKTFGSRFDRVHRNDLNANFAAVEADINAQKNRVDELITKAPQPSEVVDARGGFPVLSGRLNDLSSSLAQSVMKRSLKSFGAKANANFYKLADGKWYEDSAYMILANDDTQAIKDFIAWYALNSPNDLILFERGNYLVTSTIIIPQGCRHIDFNYAAFRYHGVTGSYAIQGDIPDEETGGYYYADFKNLYINCSPDKTCNGINLARLRGSILYNIYVNYADVGIKLNNSWSSELSQCRTYYCHTGMLLANYSNGINISKADINSCDVGIALGRNGVCYGVIINNQTLIQNCLVAIEANHIQQAGIDGAYFELNTLLFDFPNLADTSQGVYNFNVKNCIFDIGTDKANSVNFNANSRVIVFNISDSKINGKNTSTFFKYTTGNIQSIIFENISFSIATTFLELFPSTFHVEKVKTDIPYYPTISTTNWELYTTPYILCMGRGNFALYGSIKRKTGTSSQTIATGMPYYITSETKKFSYLVHQGDVATAGGKKTAKVDVSNNGNIYIYTDDNTDLNTINLNGIQWTVNN
jgi:hypothetical protein